MGKLLAAVAASVLVATPAMANQAASLSVANAAPVKAKTSSSKSNNLSSEVGIGLGLLFTGALVAVVADGGDSK